MQGLRRRNPVSSPPTIEEDDEYEVGRGVLHEGEIMTHSINEFSRGSIERNPTFSERKDMNPEIEQDQKQQNSVKDL